LLIRGEPKEREVSGTWSEVDWVGNTILFVGLTLLLCGIAMGVRYIWRRLHTQRVKDTYYWVYKTLLRNPWQMLSRPFRRLHRRWSEKNLRAKMAKFEERIIADKILDVLYDEVEAGRISKGRFRRLQTQMGEFFNISDLCRRKLHPEAIKAMRAKEKLKGPTGNKNNPSPKIPGGKPGENVIPLYEGLGHKYLSKKQAS
jgi:hypothetical protein